jgi:hypothetical protein
MSNHLLIGRSIAGWAYAEDPFKIIWSATSDGEMLSLTYLKEQEVIGWAHHDTYGLFTSVAQIPEGNTSAVYVVVKRTMLGNGSVHRTDERKRIHLRLRGRFLRRCGVEVNADGARGGT